MTVKMLFVDDEPKLQDVIRQLFRYETRTKQYELYFALNGNEALELIQANHQIDIVLTDLNMPGMNGLTLLNKLQDLKPTFNPFLTTVVVSAYGDMENIRKAMNAGAFDFLNKPLDFEDVRITIAKAIAHIENLKAARTQEQRAEEALKEMNQELERRVEIRTTELQQINAELNAFAHTVAHDLKNPLGIIAGYVDYAIEYVRELEQEEILETLQNVQRYSFKALNIVNDLMLLSGVRKLDVPRMAIDMSQVVDNAQKRLTPLFTNNEVQIFTPDTWPVAMGYAPWIEEVWVNYISNAIKYGGNPPQLELGATEHDDGTICFWVKDNGAGIALEDQQKLFAEFIRLPESNHAEGYGLGLSIVHRILDRLNGEAGVSSEPGHGSQFYFTLPAA